MKHQNRGRFDGIPTRRGRFSGHGARWTSTWKVAVDSCRSRRGDRPSSARAPTCQRAPSLPGGSLTTKSPPLVRRGAAHSAVTAGGPKLRATTSACAPRWVGSRPTISARSPTTPTRPVRPRRSTASIRKSARRRLASTRAQVEAGQWAASTRPGTPPPLPRSRQAFGVSDATSATARAKPPACSMCVSRGPGPRKPRWRASSRTSTRSAGGTDCVRSRRRAGSPRAAEALHPPRSSTRRRSRSQCHARPCDQRPAWARALWPRPRSAPARPLRC